MTLYAISSSWLPAIHISDCDKEGKNCKSHYGFYVDLIDAMGSLMNFTWEDRKELNDDWGLQPISGPYNKSGVWGGVLGSIINGEYMFNTADWLMTPKRIGLIEFVMSTKDVYLLALTPKPAKFDMGLFVRPFTTESWIGKTLSHLVRHCSLHTFLINPTCFLFLQLLELFYVYH